MTKIRRNLALFIAFLWLAPSINAADNYANITQHEVFLENNYLRLQAETKISLSDEMLDALKHNIPLTFIWKIKIEKNRSWYIWDKDLYDRELTRKLFLSRSIGMYALHNPDNKKTVYYRQFADALKALARIDIVNLVTADKLRKGDLYTSSIKFEFKPSSLPAAIYLKGMFSKNWKLESNWYLKRFNP